MIILSTGQPRESTPSDTSIDVTSSAAWTCQSGSGSVSVNSSGTVSCPGDITSTQTAVIRASYNSETADETVTFNPNLSYAIVIVPFEVSIVIGEQCELRADIYRVFGTVRESTPVVTDADVTWATEGATTASVIGWTARSTIVGYSVGQVYVTASCTYQGQQVTTASADRCHVTVTDNTTYRLIVTPSASTNPTLEKGYAATYRLYRQAMVGGVDTGAPVLIPNSEATWTSSNTAVASFDNAASYPGKISAKAAGIVTVTATLKSTAEYYNSYTINGRTATSTLTVLDVNPEPGVDDGWDDKPTIIL